MPATPNSQLQKRYQREIYIAARLKVKVVEKAGVAIKRLLPESEPFKPLHCEGEDCVVCRTNRRSPCDRQSVTYEINCTKCDNVFVGETSGSTYTKKKKRKVFRQKEEQTVSIAGMSRDLHDNKKHVAYCADYTCVAYTKSNPHNAMDLSR